MTDEARLLEEKYGVHDASALEGADAARYEAYEEDKKRLAFGEPLAYVIGWQPFLGLKIWLDSKPLIPRPETEWITEKLIAHLKDAAKPRRILDLCAGSGAIGCALLAALPEAQVSFGELMPTHEGTIRKNIAENKLDSTRMDIRVGDLFAPFNSENGDAEKFDIIVSNPPYIPDDRVLDDSVTRFEPAEALRGGSDGLDVIRRIASEAAKHLNPGGELWLEIDAPFADEARALVEEGMGQNGQASLYPDPYGRSRLVVGHYAQ